MGIIHLSFLLMFTLGFLGLASNRKYLLSALLCLEMMMLSIYMNMTTWSYQTASNIFSPMPIILLSFSACEASAGLALLVATTRTHGMVNLANFNYLKC